MLFRSLSYSMVNNFLFVLYNFFSNARSFMWNKITGSIPKEIGNIKSLELLLVQDFVVYFPALFALGLAANFTFPGS